ncbi:MAG: hypothetical protein KAH95_08600 [Spirochaetales bacterium]|nr:hypothetical protein [Spirochaetales bacterium]
MSLEKKPFKCDLCGNEHSFIWKTRKGKKTKILLIFGLALLNQLQVQCKTCGHKMNITRKLLDLAPRKKIPAQTIRKLGLIGALTTFRVAKKIVGMFGWELDKMTIWRSVQKLAKEIDFDLDLNEVAHGEADGTGIPIQGIKKRGKELKVFVQLKKTGGVRIAGLSIGNYDSQWEKLFGPLIPKLRQFKQFLLVTDGDTSILKPLEDKVEILFQRCLWHIPHQFKWYLWKDKVKRKSDEWIHSLCSLVDISVVRSLQDDDIITQNMIKLKKQKLNDLIQYCYDKGWKSCTTYLTNAAPDMFTAIENRLEGKTSSRVERVMRTVNLRINAGKWSTSGALNAMKIRLAYYYNGFDVE